MMREESAPIDLKLQKHKTHVYKGKEYSKWVFVIPAKIIVELDWNERGKYQANVKNDKLIIEKK